MLRAFRAVGGRGGLGGLAAPFLASLPRSGAHILVFAAVSIC